MRIKYILNALGLVMMLFGGVILAPIIMAIIDKDYFSIIPFVTASAISLVVGFLFKKVVGKGSNLNDLKRTEALFIVALTWISLGLIAGVPYLFYGLSPVNSLFEAVSGITTTGSTILTDFSLYPKTFFLWRSFTQWLGGMGIIVLFIAILPQFAVAGRQMFFAEAPGPTEDKITPRIRHTATALWGVYFFLTLAEIVALKFAGMPLFDAVCNSLSTLAAGGFSPNAQSILGYGSDKITWIVTFFMFLAGANFALQYKFLVQRKLDAMIKSEEFRWYSSIFLIISGIIAFILFLESNFSWHTSIKDAMFQTISILTTAGFASFDFENWITPAKVMLFVLMLIGGCAGSAGGGLKVVRILFGYKYLKREVSQIIHPKAVLPIKIDNINMPHDVLRQTLAFIIFYFVIACFSSLLISMIEGDIVTGISGTFATLGNIGPGFGQIGPMGSFDTLHLSTKIVFIVNMIVGRLELIPFLAMLHPEFWNLKFK